jgi:hypothetical protein
MAFARNYFEMQAKRLMLGVTVINCMLPSDDAPAQQSRVDLKRIAYGLETKRIPVAGLGHDPVLGVNVKPPHPRDARMRALLVNVNRVSQ